MRRLRRVRSQRQRRARGGRGVFQLGTHRAPHLEHVERRGDGVATPATSARLMPCWTTTGWTSRRNIRGRVTALKNFRGLPARSLVTLPPLSLSTKVRDLSNCTMCTTLAISLLRLTGKKVLFAFTFLLVLFSFPSYLRLLHATPRDTIYRILHYLSFTPIDAVVVAQEPAQESVACHSSRPEVARRVECSSWLLMLLRSLRSLFRLL